MNDLQQRRLAYQPVVPDLLLRLDQVHLKEEMGGVGKKPDEALRKRFPKTFNGRSFVLAMGEAKKRNILRVGVVFSGGPASGGHNVIAGIFFAVKSVHPESRVFGFLEGPSGIIENRKRELFDREIAAYLNQGGFDLIGSGRTKIETEDQLASSLTTCKEMRLDGLIIIGGDDSNTNAAILAEYFLDKGCPTRVIGVPKTIDGDLQSPNIAISFGFDTACKTYEELIGNIARDAFSSKKYYHFIKLMGRSASHVTLECALVTHPNFALISEERKSLKQIIQEISDLIFRRQEMGKEYGVILIPEGWIEFIPEIQVLLFSLNRLSAQDPSLLPDRLSDEERNLFFEFPDTMQTQLLLERDPHGNVQLSQIDTQRFLIDLVKKELKRRKFKGKFSVQEHFFGYEGRACFPTNFDSNYCYTLGLLAALAVRDELTGVICSVQHLEKKTKEWTMKAVPIIQLMHLETRLGKEKPVIQKTLVDLSGRPFLEFARKRQSWEIDDLYRYPGPIQFFGDPEFTDSVPKIL